jgi:AraC-like DNA-binding protein
VVGVCGGQALDPFTVYGLAKWGMDDLVQWGQAPTSREVDGIVLRAVTRGWRHRLEDALLESVAPDDRLAVQAEFRAAAGCLARGEWSVPAMARELFRSRSALERDMRELGLVTPGKFIRRLRLALVLLPRRVLGADALLARLWGFYSVGDLSNQVRRNLGVSIGWFAEASEAEALDRLSCALRDGGQRTLASSPGGRVPTPRPGTKPS